MNKPESKELSATKRVSARRASTDSDLPAAEKTGTIAKRVHARRASAEPEPALAREPVPAQDEQRPDAPAATEGLAFAGAAPASERGAEAPQAREGLAFAPAPASERGAEAPQAREGLTFAPAPASERGAEAPQPSEGPTSASAKAPHATPAAPTPDVGERVHAESASTVGDAGAVMSQPAAAAPSSVPPPRVRARRPRAKQASNSPTQAPATPPTAATPTAQSALAEPSATAAPQHAAPPAPADASADDSAALKRDFVAVAAVASAPPPQPSEVASEPAAAVEGSPAVQSSVAAHEPAPRESAIVEAKRWSTSMQAAEEIPPPALDHVDFADDFGLDAEYETKLRPWLESLCERHFHVELYGAEHIPAHGRALLVANHSRASVWDGILLRAALRQHHPAGRVPRWLVDDQQFHAPFLGTIVNRLGAVRACQENAERLLLREELVAVFPEGSKATQRPYEDRYRLQRFGRGGYVKLALRTGTPVFPVAIVATEYEGAVWRNRFASASRVLSAPFAALRPGFPRIGLLGVPPISARIRIYVGASVDEISRHDASVTQDDALVHELNECVRSAVQNLVNASLHS